MHQTLSQQLVERILGLFFLFHSWKTKLEMVATRFVVLRAVLQQQEPGLIHYTVKEGHYGQTVLFGLLRQLKGIIRPIALIVSVQCCRVAGLGFASGLVALAFLAIQKNRANDCLKKTCVNS